MCEGARPRFARDISNLEIAFRVVTLIIAARGGGEREFCLHSLTMCSGGLMLNIAIMHGDHKYFAAAILPLALLEITAYEIFSGSKHNVRA